MECVDCGSVLCGTTTSQVRDWTLPDTFYQYGSTHKLTVHGDGNNKEKVNDT